jgi:hypothetical protein
MGQGDPLNNLVSIQSASGIRMSTMGFVIDSGSGCTPAWGGVGTKVSNDTTFTTMINNVRAAGGDVIVSFGGAAGTELAHSTGCATASQLQAAYQQVINKYGARVLDFDIEGAAVNNPKRSDGVNSVDLRNQALTALAAANPGLEIHYTLPVLPSGLVQSGINVLKSIAANHTPVSVVNVMAMDYGTPVPTDGMGPDANQAATNTLQQMAANGVSASVGITVLIGNQDETDETFTLNDAQTVLSFAQSNANVALLSYWASARDNGSCPGVAGDSDTCSGLAQSTWQFANIFEAFR